MQFFIVFISVVFGSQSMGQFFTHSSDMSKGLSSTRAIYALSDSIPVKCGRAEIPIQTINEIDSTTPLVEFRNVNFAYPARPSHHVLKGFNMKIYPGQTIALVGASGCGKSTIIQLLENFYQISSGEILIAGIPIQNYDLESLRQLFALVSQEPVLYQGTIEENINLGRSIPLSELELERIIAQGTQLSGGQKQRVAIARAIAIDAPVLLLDEATSALDSESESMIQNALNEGSQGKTVIAVAHRLSTIQHADCIFVLDAGTVIESGRHESLLGNRGRYWEMVRA